MTRPQALALTLGLVLFTSGAVPAMACMPTFPYPLFWFPQRSGPSFERTVEGEIGVLDVGLSSSTVSSSPIAT